MIGPDSSLTVDEDRCRQRVGAKWTKHGWRPDVERIRPFTSALHALHVALWNSTERGDGVVVITPIHSTSDTIVDRIADVVGQSSIA